MLANSECNTQLIVEFITSVTMDAKDICIYISCLISALSVHSVMLVRFRNNKKPTAFTIKGNTYFGADITRVKYSWHMCFSTKGNAG